MLASPPDWLRFSLREDDRSRKEVLALMGY